MCGYATNLMFISPTQSQIMEKKQKLTISTKGGEIDTTPKNALKSKKKIFFFFYQIIEHFSWFYKGVWGRVLWKFFWVNELLKNVVSFSPPPLVLIGLKEGGGGRRWISLPPVFCRFVFFGSIWTTFSRGIFYFKPDFMSKFKILMSKFSKIAENRY